MLYAGHRHLHRKGADMSTEATTATLYPYVLCRDVDAEMDWLERALGFERGEVHRDDGGHVQHAEMKVGSAVVMLGTAGVGREPFSSLPAGGALIYCGVQEGDPP